MQHTTAPAFVTLGPPGTNHELVTRAYLAFRGIDAARIHLVEDFHDGLSREPPSHRPGGAKTPQTLSRKRALRVTTTSQNRLFRAAP